MYRQELKESDEKLYAKFVNWINANVSMNTITEETAEIDEYDNIVSVDRVEHVGIEQYNCNVIGCVASYDEIIEPNEPALIKHFLKYHKDD